jgi:tetratricopeptide (TPR) repeat protein
VRVAWLTYELDSHSVANIEQALRHDAGNPDLYYRLGMVYAMEPTDVNLAESVKNLHKATELNPRRGDFWADLGKVCDYVGDTACSDEAFAHAVELNPMAPGLWWGAGNHYLLTNREEKSFPYFRRLLELDPDYWDATFRLCLRATRDPMAVYAQVVSGGPDPTPRFRYLMFLSSSADYESAMQVWRKMIAEPNRSASLAQVKPFLDFLIDHNQLQDAGVVWSDLQRTQAVAAPAAAEPGNLIYDAGFQAARLNTGFDWRVSDSPNLIFDFSARSEHTAGKCLRIDFAIGRDADYDLLNQVVLVRPQTRYQLQVWVRSDEITSSSGPRLKVTEMGCPNCPEQTSAPTVGTTPWHLLEVPFVTQPQTQAVRISFWRPQDRHYSRDITGTVWLDDLTLRAVDAPGAVGTPGRTP